MRYVIMSSSEIIAWLLFCFVFGRIVAIMV